MSTPSGAAGTRGCRLQPLTLVSRVSPQLQPEQLDCGAAHLQHPLAIVNPLAASPVFTYSGLTAVAVASVNNYTVAFLGTASGALLKASGAPAGTGLGWRVSPSRTSGLCRGQCLLSSLSEHLLSFGSEEVIGCCCNLYSDCAA